jgi:uncharacterized protein
VIIYFDTSALVKRYVEEAGSREVAALFEEEHAILGSVIIAQVEMAAALQRAIRIAIDTESLLSEIWQDFLEDWKSFTRIQVSGSLVERASQLSFTHKLRGYDALHLAAASLWQEKLAMPVVLACFDRELWLAGRHAGLEVWPERLG